MRRRPEKGYARTIPPSVLLNNCARWIDDAEKDEREFVKRFFPLFYGGKSACWLPFLHLLAPTIIHFHAGAGDNDGQEEGGGGNAVLSQHGDNMVHRTHCISIRSACTLMASRIMCLCSL